MERDYDPWRKCTATHGPVLYPLVLLLYEPLEVDPCNDLHALRCHTLGRTLLLDLQHHIRTDLAMVENRKYANLP